MRRHWGKSLDEAEHCTGDPAVLGGERYVLWMIRRTVFCPGEPDLAERSLIRRLGSERGREACLALRLLLYSVSLFGRRPLCLGPPAAAETTPDERCLLQLVAAAQHRSDYLLEASLLWLSSPEAPVTPRVPALRLAALLAEGAMLLPRPRCPEPPVWREPARAVR